MLARTRPNQAGNYITKSSQKLQRIGSCIVFVGLLMSIMGVIFTIVAYGGGDGEDKVTGFSVAGPCLISFAILFFVLGCTLYQMSESCSSWCQSCHPKGTTKYDIFISLLCGLCRIANESRLRTDSLSSLHEPPSNPTSPKSILQNSHVSAMCGHKKPTHMHSSHVHFQPTSSEEGSLTKERSDSLLSLQRHCRVHPTPETVDGSGQVSDRPDQPGRSSDRHNPVEINSTKENTALKSRPTSASDVTPVFVTVNERARSELV